MVVIDKFSKFAHFILLHHPFLASGATQDFRDHVYWLHKLPTHIISDYDLIFTIQFWKEAERAIRM